MDSDSDNILILIYSNNKSASGLSKILYSRGKKHKPSKEKSSFTGIISANRTHLSSNTVLCKNRRHMQRNAKRIIKLNISTLKGAQQLSG